MSTWKNFPLCLLLSSALLGVSLGACSEVGAANRPYRMHLVSDGGQADELRLAALVEYLESYVSVALFEEEGNFHIEGQLHPNEASALEALASGHADLAAISARDFARVLELEEPPLEALLAEVPAGGWARSAGRVVVRADSEITELSGLSAKGLAWSDDRVAQIHAALLAEAGVEVGEALVLEDEGQVLASIASGEVQAGVVSAEVEPGPGFHMVGEIPPVPPDPWVVRLHGLSQSDLGITLEGALRQGLMSFAGSLEGAQLLEELCGIRGLASAEANSYLDFREALGRMSPLQSGP